MSDTYFICNIWNYLIDSYFKNGQHVRMDSTFSHLIIMMLAHHAPFTNETIREYLSIAQEIEGDDYIDDLKAELPDIHYLQLSEYISSLNSDRFTERDFRLLVDVIKNYR